MKPVILYESKHGATETCATYLENNLPGSILSKVQDWEKDFQPNQPIILGTCIYMGQFNKHVKAFLEEHETKLLQHPLYIFYCAMNESEMETMIENNLSPDMRDHATVIHAGGAYNFEHMKWWERFIVKKIAKVTTSTSNIKYDKLDTIIKRVNA